MAEKNPIQINKDDVQFIMGENFIHFPKLEKNGFCPKCGGSLGNNVTEIVNYEIYLNDLCDVILRGSCKKCDRPVNRYIETGEVPEERKRAETVWRRSTLKLL